jgi:hypothetical protein
VYTRVAGIYSVVTNIKGPAGADGNDGNAGADGSVWRNGSGAPSNGLGANGDYYLNTANGNVYTRVAGIYSVVTNIKGTAGADGPTYIEITGGTSATNATGTRWAHPAFKQASTPGNSNTQKYRIRTARTLTEINVYNLTAMPADGTFTITVQKNDVDTSMSVQFAASAPLYTVKSTTANPVSFAAGDFYTLKIVKVAATAAPSFEIVSSFTL